MIPDDSGHASNGDDGSEKGEQSDSEAEDDEYRKKLNATSATSNSKPVRVIFGPAPVFSSQKISQYIGRRNDEHCPNSNDGLKPRVRYTGTRSWRDTIYLDLAVPFDDVFGAPGIDNLSQIIRGDTLREILQAHGALQEWGDKGWRRGPNGHRICNVKEAQYLPEHLEPASSDQFCPTLLGDDGNDSSRYSMADFVARCKDEGHLLEALTGMIDGTYCILDAEIDASGCSNNAKSISTSVDIDSLIHVYGRSFKLAGGHQMPIYTRPQLETIPHIKKDNQIRVKLLCPPLVAGRIGPCASQWRIKEMKLSQIPHLLVGIKGEGSATFFLLMFFPRMCHQQKGGENRMYWKVVMPHHVVLAFYNEVLSPAISKVKGEPVSAYTPLTSEIWGYKNPKGTKHMTPFVSEELEELQRAMEDIVRSCLTLIRTQMSSLCRTDSRQEKPSEIRLFFLCP